MEDAIPGSAGDGQGGCRRQHRQGPHGRAPGGGGRGAKRSADGSAGGPEAVPQDGLFQPLPGGSRQRDRDGGLGRPKPGGRRSGPGDRGCDRDDRPVPQVDPVGPDAQPAQRWQAQQRAHRAGGGCGGGQAGRCQRCDGQPEGVDRWVGAGEVAHGPRQHHEPGHPEVVQSARELPWRVGERGHRPGQGQRRAHQQPGRVSVGPVVHPGGIAAGQVDERRGRRRGERPQPGGQHPGPPSPQAGEHQQHQERPDQVELLFDGEGPQVLKWRWRSGRGEIRDVVKSLVPVARVAARGGQRGPERGQLIGFDNGHRRGDSDQDHGEGGQ